MHFVGGWGQLRIILEIYSTLDFKVDVLCILLFSAIYKLLQ